MADFQRADPRDWNYDLHSVYSAYLGHFQVHHIAWYDRSWANLFESFADFLATSWPCMVVTSSTTGKAHIVTRFRAVGDFVKMVKTRFGDILPHVDNILFVEPFETSPRRVHMVEDFSAYRKLHATLPAAALAAYRARVRAGDPKAILDLWNARDKNFVAVDFEWSERNPNSALEWGYAAARCGHLSDVGAWPPDPETNYRKGHYVVSDYLDKMHNKHVPNYPRYYAFGESALVAKQRLPVIINAIISSLATPDSETVPNGLVLVGHGMQGELERMDALKIKIPHNVLVIDIANFERALFAAGKRGAMTDMKTGQPRSNTATLSVDNILRSLGVDVKMTLHNSGNDAFLALLALQLLIAPEGTPVPPVVGHGGVRRSSTMPMLQMPLPTPGNIPSPGPFSGSPLTPPMMHPGFLTPTPPLGSPTGNGFVMNGGRPLSEGYFSQSQRRSSGGTLNLPRPASGLSMNGRNRFSSFTPDDMGALSPPKSSTQRGSSTERSTPKEADKNRTDRPVSDDFGRENSKKSNGDNRLSRAMKKMALG